MNAVEWSPLDLPCEYCGDRVRDHTPMELKSCVRDLAIRDAAKRMSQAIDDLPVPDVEKQILRRDLATLGREGRSACVTCGHYGSYDNELILDDEGDVFCEECWNP